MSTDTAATLMALADFLIPAHDEMPAFSTVCDMKAVETSLGFRPDLKDAFRGALTSADLAEGAEAALERLNRSNPQGFSALTLILVTTYYMQPKVRELIGYPGQEHVDYDPKATQAYLTDGMLGRVIGRGRKYRPTPGLNPEGL
jgi:hypothetical protein